MDNELTTETILEIARERYRNGSDIRGLPRPADAPPGSYYAVQHRRLRSGGPAVYLYLRWPPRPDEPKGPRGRVPTRPARSLGRLN